MVKGFETASITTTLGVQNLPKIALSLTDFEINNIFHLCQNSRWWPQILQEWSLVPQGVQHLPKMALSPMVLEINDIFHFFQNSEKSKFVRGPREVVLSTLGVQNLPQIALSLTFFKIIDILHFRQNSRWQPKIRKVSRFFEDPKEVVLRQEGPKFAEIALSV